ncbi:MAG: ribosome-binding ATPase YchF [Candidatus Binatia bacterium]|nr:MAG: ribosome-binding ATPase YchF [Candidatus Binatia bacterium]
MAGVLPASREPAVVSVKLPDPRLDRLAELVRPPKVVPVEMSFVDFPGQESGLPPSLVGALRDSDAVVLVLRGFPDPFTQEAATPEAEFDFLLSELVLADLAVAEKRLERVRKERGDPHEEGLLARAVECLEEGRLLSSLPWSEADAARTSGYAFLTRKPLLAVWNVHERELSNPFPRELERRVRAAGVPLLRVSAAIEAELEELDSEEREAFLSELGLSEPASRRFVRECHSALGRISFFTIGKREVRAWSIPRGTTALRAAGRVHSDMERGFIRAEVVAYEDFVHLGSESRCREAGKMRLEGKEYVLRDGDIVRFRFHAPAGA